MSNAYDRKIDLDLDEATSQLGKLMAKARQGDPDAQKQGEVLEQAIEKVRARIKELEEADDNTTSRFSDSLDEAWGEMKNEMRKAEHVLGGEGL